MAGAQEPEVMSTKQVRIAALAERFRSVPSRLWRTISMPSG